jgi:hypothetical protein
MCENNLKPVLNELHKAFDLYNEEFFGGALPQVVITIQSQGKRSAYGWISVQKVWSDGAGSELHEINISAEHIGSRDNKMVDVLQTLLHEMIHLYALENDIKDVSRNGSYHNKSFKANAEAHGMEYTHDGPDSKIGYSAITLTDETKEIIAEWDLDESAFGLTRAGDGGGEKKKGKKKSNIVKWVCGCDVIIRSSKPEINVICGDCGTKFEKQESGDDE